MNPVPRFLAAEIRSWGFHSLTALDPHCSIANLKVYKLDLVISLHYVSIPRERD